MKQYKLIKKHSDVLVAIIGALGLAFGGRYVMVKIPINLNFGDTYIQDNHPEPKIPRSRSHLP